MGEICIGKYNSVNRFQKPASYFQIVFSQYDFIDAFMIEIRTVEDDSNSQFTGNRYLKRNVFLFKKNVLHACLFVCVWRGE
jgi:hypothetical protein